LTFQLSKSARSDLREIARFTTHRWGKAQATAYILQLRERCQQLATSPNVGRSNRGDPFGLRRVESGSHVVYYQQREDDIWIVRILHKSMLPSRHLMHDSD
jgi:toxin ParE1/3/4